MSLIGGFDYSFYYLGSRFVTPEGGRSYFPLYLVRQLRVTADTFPDNVKKCRQRTCRITKNTRTVPGGFR